MRVSHLFGRTLRDAPADAALISHRLALRAGLARSLAPGLWSYLPLGWRVVRRIEALIRAALEPLGAQEFGLPAGEDPAQAAAALCAREVESYKDLPRLLLHIGARTRDQADGRGGLFGLRAAHVVDALYLHAEAEEHAGHGCPGDALPGVFAACDLPVITVEAGPEAQAFALPLDGGPDRLARCDACGYAATFEAAAFARSEARYGDPLPLEQVATPDCKTIADLCAYLGIPPERTLKAVFYTIDAGQTFVLAMLRGDLDVSEERLRRVLGVDTLEPASEEQIAAAGAQPGYGSPIGLDVRPPGGDRGAVVIADESLLSMSNFVTGANVPGYHAINANYPRDFAATQVAAIAAPFNGAPCARCGSPLRVEEGAVLASCEPLGAAPGAAFLDAQGQPQPVLVGRCTLAIDRLLAAVIETHHDDYGILWPRAVAPFDVHLVALAKDPALFDTADRLYADLRAVGLEVLYDDRGLSPGVMFADADLIGVPLRVTVSTRSLEADGVEVKWRHEKERTILPLDGAAQAVRALLSG